MRVRSAKHYASRQQFLLRGFFHKPECAQRRRNCPERERQPSSVIDARAVRNPSACPCDTVTTYLVDFNLNSSALLCPNCRAHVCRDL
jgi:hypothetical protein